MGVTMKRRPRWVVWTTLFLMTSFTIAGGFFGGVSTGWGSIIVPTASGTTTVPSIKFEGPVGASVVDPAHWYQFNQFGGVSNHDKVLAHCFNCTWNETNSWQRAIDGVHAVRVGYESRFHATDPANVRGDFEFNIDIDRATTGAINFADRPFFFRYNMDTSALKRRAYLAIGQDSDTRSAFFEMAATGQIRIQSGTDDSAARQRIILEGYTVLGEAGADVSTPARAFVDGTVDEIQLRVQGNATQTSAIVQFEGDGAVPYSRVIVDGAGVGNEEVRALGMFESDTDPYCDVGEFRIFADNSEGKFKACENSTQKRQLATQTTGTVTVDIGALAATCLESGDVTITSAAFGDGCVLGTSAALPAGTIGGCRITAAGTARVVVCGTGDPANMTYTLRTMR